MHYKIDPMYFDHELAKLGFYTNEDAKHVRVDFIWYTSKKKAQDAAAARAIECFHFRYPSSRQNISNATNIQYHYCEEEPYGSNAIPGVWKAISDTVEGVTSTQPKFDSDDVYKYFYESWPKLLGKVSEETLWSVFEPDEENDAVLRAYRECREMEYLDNFEEDE